MDQSRARIAALALWLAWVPLGCGAGAGIAATSPAPSAQEREDLKSFRAIEQTLEKVGPTMDYDTLMAVYLAMAQAQKPIAHMDRLLRLYIEKRNPDPRVDQMILIFAARTMGGSKYPIAGAQEIFESILKQDQRVNSWVIAFVAEAVGDYPFDLPGGNQLVDFMEARLARHRAEDYSGEEYFGYHFLPPPKSDFIRAYIDGIEVRSVRQSERNRYYLLIENELTEQQIEPALRYLRAHGAPDSGEKCPRLLECLMRYRRQLPFEPPR